MKKSIWYLIVLLIIASFVIVGCAQASSSPSPSATQPPATTQAPSTSISAPATTTQPSQTAGPSSTSPAAGGVIKIGHIRPLTGNMAMTSDIMVKSFDYAF